MDKRRLALLAAVLGLAALLRLPGLGSALPLGNEYLFIHFSVHPAGWAAFHDVARGNALHLLLDQAVDFLIARWRDDPGWMRLPAALWGAAVLASGDFARRPGWRVMRRWPPSCWRRRCSTWSGRGARRCTPISALTVWQAAAFARLVRRERPRASRPSTWL